VKAVIDPEPRAAIAIPRDGRLSWKSGLVSGPPR